MQKYNKMKQKSKTAFKRCVGITLKQFHRIRNLICEYIAQQKEYNKLKKRGSKSGISISDKLLLTLYYMRNYPTFISLGLVFDISESYANKIYHRILNIMVKVLHIGSKKELCSADLKDIAIDVTEQDIQRPKKNQKAYYSGKKNDIQ